MQRQPKKDDLPYLAWIRQLTCLLCSDDVTVQAAHVSAGEPRVDKRHRGKGEKADDQWVLPLCSRHHADQHAYGEVRFWNLYNINPFMACLVLQKAYALEDNDMAERIIRAHHFSHQALGRLPPLERKRPN
jgi:hypothetical protein